MSSQGLGWGGVVITALVFAFRIYVRLRSFRRLFADDVLVFIAWSMLTSNALIWQLNKDALYDNIAVSSGQLFPPKSFARDSERYLRGSTVIIAFFYSGLWSVKLSFLIFFKRLGQKVRGQKILWWIVLGITIASYFAVLGTIQYRCLDSSFEYISSKSKDLISRHKLITIQKTVLGQVQSDIRGLPFYPT